MKTKIKEVYYCEYCGKHGLRKHSMVYHESICAKNPENKRPCFDCRHLDKEQIQICEDYFGQENIRNVDLFYCNKKQCFLHTPQNKTKGNLYDLGDEVNHPMPKECGVFDCNRL